MRNVNPSGELGELVLIAICMGPLAVTEAVLPLVCGQVAQP